MLRDRKDREFCLAPTHEEDITSLVAHELHSYRELPIRVYQIGILFQNDFDNRAEVPR